MLVSLLIGGSLCLLIVFGISWLLFKTYNMRFGIRVSAKAELAGLDVPELGGLAYPPDAEASLQPAAASVTSTAPVATCLATVPQLDPVSLRVRAPQQNQAWHTSPSYQGRSAIPNHQIMSKQNCWEFMKCGR